MKTAVYSGSFNPLHKGHVQVIRHLLENEDFDKVYLVVSPHNPFKDKVLSYSAQERYNAALEAVERLGLSDKVYVDDIEFGMEGPSYTVRTLDALREREPQNDFTLAIGADILPELTRWRDWGRIVSEYGVVVYPRAGFNMEKDLASVMKEAEKSCVSARIRILENAPQVDVSSTQIRDMEAHGTDSSALKA